MSFETHQLPKYIRTALWLAFSNLVANLQNILRVIFNLKTLFNYVNWQGMVSFLIILSTDFDTVDCSYSIIRNDHFQHLQYLASTDFQGALKYHHLAVDLESLIRFNQIRIASTSESDALWQLSNSFTVSTTGASFISQIYVQICQVSKSGHWLPCPVTWSLPRCWRYWR